MTPGCRSFLWKFFIFLLNKARAGRGETSINPGCISLRVGTDEKVTDDAKPDGIPTLTPPLFFSSDAFN